MWDTQGFILSLKILSYQKLMELQHEYSKVNFGINVEKLNYVKSELRLREKEFAEKHSSIDIWRGSPESLKIVLYKIEQAELPVRWYFENGFCNFVYANGKCDANTSLHLENIIKGLVGLYA